MNNKIVLIDDDHDILDIMQYILTDEGYNVAVYDELQPLDGIIAQQPSVILLDNKLANAYSNTLCLALKTHQRSKHIPVILISAAEDLEQIAKKCNADAFINKPFDLKGFIRIVKHYSLVFNNLL